MGTARSRTGRCTGKTNYRGARDFDCHLRAALHRERLPYTYQHRLQEPFEACKPPGRTNLLNYNYCFCRCFQLMKVEQFSMFFPLINIKSPLLAPGTTWGLGRALGVGRRITHDITEVACDFL